VNVEFGKHQLSVMQAKIYVEKSAEFWDNWILHLGKFVRTEVSVLRFIPNSW